MRYKLHCLRQEKEFFIKQVEEIESIILTIRALGGYKDTEEKAKRLINYYKKKALNTKKAIENFENLIDNIPDEEVKEMAKLYFFELKSCEEIGYIYYLDRTTVFKKLKRYFKI